MGVGERDLLRAAGPDARCLSLAVLGEGEEAGAPSPSAKSLKSLVSKGPRADFWDLAASKSRENNELKKSSYIPRETTHQVVKEYISYNNYSPHGP